MARIVMKNPYYEEEIKVKQNSKYFRYRLEDLQFGRIECIQLDQIEPTKVLITISPKQFAKIEVFDDEDEVE